MTDYPVTPTIELVSSDCDGQLVPNRSAATSPTRNAIDLNTGDIRSASAGGLTITKNYTTGPSGVGSTAQRVQFAAVTNAFLLYSESSYPLLLMPHEPAPIAATPAASRRIRKMTEPSFGAVSIGCHSLISANPHYSPDLVQVWLC